MPIGYKTQAKKFLVNEIDTRVRRTVINGIGIRRFPLIVTWICGHPTIF